MNKNDKPWLNQYDSGVPATIQYPPIPLQQFLRQAAQNYPSRPCTIFQDEIITYREMDLLSDRLAGVLIKSGIQKGDRVGIILPNIPQFVLCFYAILKAGGVVVAINPQYKKGEIEFQIHNTGVSVLICLDHLIQSENLIQIETDLQMLITTKVEDGLKLKEFSYKKGNSTFPFTNQSVTHLMDLLTFIPIDELPEVNPEDPAVFQFSGGTTGLPKAVVGLHRNLVANTLQFSRWLVGLREGEEVVLTAIPLYHVYGMVVAMSVGIALGAILVLVPDPRNILNILVSIQRYRASLFPGVPNLYQSINQHPDVIAGKFDLKSVKACISGSAPLSKETKEKFEQLTGGKLIEGYGLSEAPTATHCNPIFGENRIGSIGLPLPDVDCRIVSLDDEVSIVPMGEPGELIIQGPQVMMGYYRMPDETKIAIREGWLFTGDIARMDSDGYFYLVDRKKDLIKIGGFQVWPREVEEVIARNPKVNEVAVAGIPDLQRGEIVKAWIVLKPGVNCSQEEIFHYCDLYLARFKIPSQVEFRMTLPRSGVGKVLRRELVKEHLAK